MWDQNTAYDGIYGSTAAGGTYGYGTIFQLVTSDDSFTTEWSFCSGGGTCTDGKYPLGVTIGGSVALVATEEGGNSHNAGVVFDWFGDEHITLHTFCSEPSCTDGATPLTGVISDANNHLFGTTSVGGTHNDGVVYMIDYTLAPGHKRSMTGKNKTR
jgi:uncharacterized repeat protein (TIGR03803 family)